MIQVGLGCMSESVLLFGTLVALGTAADGEDLELADDEVLQFLVICGTILGVNSRTRWAPSKRAS